MPYKGAYQVARGALALGAAYQAFRSRNQTSKMGSVKETRNVSSNNFVTRQRRRTGRRRRPTVSRLDRAVKQSGHTSIYRWQNTSPTYLGPGEMAIDWINDQPIPTGDLNIERHPIHFASLSALPTTIAVDHPSKGCFAYGMNGVIYNKAFGTYYWRPFACQTATGGVAPGGHWQEDTNPYASGTDFSRVVHNWTDIKLNLYGTYTVPINYQVFMVTLPEHIDPQSFLPNIGISAGSEVANMFKDMSRYLLHSTVGQNGRVEWRKDAKIIKRFDITIQPLPYSDQVAEEALPDPIPNERGKAPHIHELRWFVRHDRQRNYNWSENAVDTFVSTDFNYPGWDVNEPNDVMCDCEWGRKPFIFITASSPERFAYTAGTAPTTEGSKERSVIGGSYDICMRNSFTFYT